VESRGCAFTDWPERLRSGHCRREDYRQSDYRYHLYVQYRMAEQMQRLGGRARDLGLGLYLDLPVGVHGAGYDLWAEPEAFLRGCAAGAPPDIVFTGGQNWGIAPLSPEGCRRQGYSYLRRVIRHHLSCAGALRIDHVMGLQRIYCVPDGFECSRGVYVGYPAHELFAALTIESHQARAMLVGEDLGTVPAEIPEALESRGIRRMHVLEYALAGDHLTFDSLTDNAVASVNTHDLVPFAGWCSGQDISLRRESGLVDEAEAEAERERRARMVEALSALLRDEGRLSENDAELDGSRVRRLLSAVLEKYGTSASPLVMVSLEDLWLEQMPQNVPGTNSDAGNWCRRMSAALEDLDGMPGLEGLVRRLRSARERAREREVHE
jgi:4-alpha-glucanotransferase